MLAKALSAATAAAAEKLYIEEVFSTWLYTGNNGTQTITNGIDLSGKGGLVWIKSRSGIQKHRLTDTARGATKSLDTNTSTGQVTESTGVTSFSSSGFAIGNDSDYNTFDANYASWTFRKAAKFFDVVTYTGNGSSTQTISHALGSVPGSIIAKGTSAATDWPVYHRSLNGGTTPEQWYVSLNATSAQSNAVANWGNVAPTSTTFTVGGNNNVNGISYVAYLFAHDAGGFGDSGNDNVVSCGSYTGNGSTNGPTVTLGWEPQWIMLKRTSGVAGWYVYDNMRGVRTGGVDSNLLPNSSQAEGSSFDYLDFNATGFKLTTDSNDHNGNGDTYIYIAIRRGPMKTPTDATKVFAAIAATASTGTSRSIEFPSDLIWARRRDASVTPQAVDRLRGLGTSSSSTTQPTFDMAVNTNAESTGGSATVYDVWNDTAKDGSYFNGQSTIWHHFRRAPGFFDVVAYTGSAATSQNVSHNLGVAAELIIVKRRVTSGYNWAVWHTALPTANLKLESPDATVTPSPLWISASSSTTFTVARDGVLNNTNSSGATYIAYLFASCPGVSKVGSYTGTGTTQQINCGFTNGARFVLVKRTDSTGDWYVWDTARGIISGNDPYLLLNSTAAEVTNTDYIDPLNSGFEISSTAPAAINANGGSFVFFAIA